MKKRKSGIILHISSLPSKYGIGNFGEKAYEFVDFLKEAGFSYWQILPIGPTSYGDSPYQSPSTFAGNPYFIDFDILNKKGLLKKEEYENIDFGSDETKVDYGKIYNNRYMVLKKAYKRFNLNELKFKKFVKNNLDWLEDYALFTVIKHKNKESVWETWEDKEKNKDDSLMREYLEKYQEEIYFVYFMQYEFFNQFFSLKKYANSKAIDIIGDVPIYCSYDSADIWSDRKNFSMDLVGGCPPDEFSLDGQLWGNPCYDYEYMAKTNFSWWVNRLKKLSNLYDLIRIDHFRGFESYWAIPKEAKSASKGKWVKGRAYELFDTIKKELRSIKLLAEDLGHVTEETIKFRKYTKIPGIKMMQFAFDHNNFNYLPHQHIEKSVVYSSTHDSETVKGFLESSLGTKKLDFCVKYLGLNKEEGYVKGFLRATWSSVSYIAMAQMQDFLELGNEARMNIPSTLGNWTYRIKSEDLTKDLARELREFNKRFDRLNEED